MASRQLTCFAQVATLPFVLTSSQPDQSIGTPKRTQHKKRTAGGGCVSAFRHTWLHRAASPDHRSHLILWECRTDLTHVHLSSGLDCPCPGQGVLELVNCYPSVCVCMCVKQMLSLSSAVWDGKKISCLGQMFSFPYKVNNNNNFQLGTGFQSLVGM